MAFLPPMTLQERYYAPIEAEIKRLFDELIYIPLFRLVASPKPPEMLNSANALSEAVAEGTVWYDDGQFKGHFNARISRDLRSLGATWNERARTWSLPKDRIPVEVRLAQADADSRYKNLRRAMLQTLNDVDIAIVDTKSKLVTKYAKALDQMEMSFRQSISAVDAISIPVQMTEIQRMIIAKEWSQNLDLDIKKWTGAEVISLRKKITQPILSGQRAESLVRNIQVSHGVSLNKAKFLARQETSLLMSKFQKIRYMDIGITKYKWSTSHDERVRPMEGANPRNGDHRILNGKIFSFDDPPITCLRTGARNNPGEDYNCRCVAIPIVE